MCSLKICVLISPYILILKISDNKVRMRTKLVLYEQLFQVIWEDVLVITEQKYIAEITYGNSNWF